MQLEKTPGTSWCLLISFHLSFGSFVSFSFSLSFGCSLFLPWKERKTQLRYRPRTAHTFLSLLVKTSMQKAGAQQIQWASLCPNLWDGSAFPKCLPKARASPSSLGPCVMKGRTQHCSTCLCLCRLSSLPQRVTQAVTQPKHSSLGLHNSC